MNVLLEHNSVELRTNWTEKDDKVIWQNGERITLSLDGGVIFVIFSLISRIRHATNVNHRGHQQKYFGNMHIEKKLELKLYEMLNRIGCSRIKNLNVIDRSDFLRCLI